MIQRVSKGVQRREDPPIVPIAAVGQTVEVFHLTAEFVEYLDRLIGLMDTQFDGFGVLSLIRRKGEMERVELGTEFRKGHNF